MSKEPASTAPLPRPVPPRRARDRWTERAVRLLLALPYRARVRLAGALGGALARLTPLPARIATAVSHFRPELSQAEVLRIARAVPGNLARMAIENFSGDEFARHARDSPLEGPGLPALEAAIAARRPVILVTAHFGNYDAARAALLARGAPVAGVYRPFKDKGLNERYVRAIGAVGQPLFPTTREGTAGMVRHLRGGGIIGILIDLDRPKGVLLDFLGKPTRTVLSMAEMALKYDALLLPVYGIRQPDGLGFRVLLDTSVPAGDPREMTQALNDSLSAMIRKHPEQWLWWHNRRKGGHP